MPSPARDRSVLLAFFLPLDYLRKVRFPGLAGPDPVGAFAREIEQLLAGLSHN